MERVDRADPENPNRTVRVFRVVDPLDELARRGSLSPAQLAAAERLRADDALAQGHRERLPLAAGGIMGTDMGFCPADASLDAQGRLRRLWGSPPYPAWRKIVRLVVIEGRSIESVAIACGMRRISVPEMLREGLDVCVEFYGC